MRAVETSTPGTRKERGAFFTPPPIAKFLAKWAIAGPDAKVLDPTCGEAVFLLAAEAELKQRNSDPAKFRGLLTGVDLHKPSLEHSRRALSNAGADTNFICSDIFDLPAAGKPEDRIGWQDAVIGNPPFIRYQEFNGEMRRRGLAAALAQGVRLSQLTSSWAPTLVHASSFLKPTGRLAMVLPAELLTVHYAEPIRRWLRERFAAVNLVMFENLQFEGAEEQVVLLVAHGKGPCDSFCLINVDGADDLAKIHPLDSVGANPSAAGKWSDLMLPLETRQLIKQVGNQMSRLDDYGTPELGTVTGANDYFAMSEPTRIEYGIDPKHLVRISPPGTRHLRGLSFTRAQWEELRLSGERVWLLNPQAPLRAAGLKRYIAEGEKKKVHEAYKCMIRNPWWRPSTVPTPDLFFTYMSHRYPRIIGNTSGATILNSMHGIRVPLELRKEARRALPLLTLNSATMLSAELMGRSYGGGVLKMEPREAAGLLVPTADDLRSAWIQLASRRSSLNAALARGEWWTVVSDIDKTLLVDAMGLDADDVVALRDAATLLRVRRTRQSETNGSKP